MGFYKRSFAMFLSKIIRAADHPYLSGKGGRLMNNSVSSMRGLSIKSLKHHVALQPLFAIMGAGIVFVAVYCAKLATCPPDVNWTKDKNHHVDYYVNRQFKFLNPKGVDYTTISDKRGAPNYTE